MEQHRRSGGPAGEENDFVSADDIDRRRPRPIPGRPGGGADGLFEQVNAKSAVALGELVDSVGRTTHTAEDDVYLLRKEGPLAGLPGAVALARGDGV